MAKESTTTESLPVTLPPTVAVPTPVPAGAVPVRATARALPVRRQGRQRKVKRALWAVLAAGLTTALALALRPHPVPVETAAAVRGTLVITVDEDGRTRVRDRYLVSAPLAGTLARMALRPGDSVERGAIVARLVPVAAPLLDPRSREEAQARIAAARAALNQAAAAVASARAASDFTTRDAERQRTLLRAGASAPQLVEQAELAERMRREELASAEFGERVAASELRLAQAAMARLATSSREEFPVRAPVRGRVLRVLQESEGVVQAGTPLLELGDPAALEVVVDVLTTDAVSIRAGATVRIERWGGDSALTGHVHYVEPSAFTRLSALGVEEQRVNVVIALDRRSAARTELGDGYRVEASIAVWEGRDRLLIPAGAVFRRGDGWATYVAQDGRAQLRPIRVGRRNGAQAEVLSGVEPGDRVVLYPTDNVTDRVRIAER
jgi:HlyD family secretion protein